MAEHWLFNWDQYYYALISALLGLFIGAWLTNRKWKSEVQNRRHNLRKDLISAFKFNIERIKQCINQLESSPPSIPNYQLDESSITQILYSGRELFDNPDDFREFNWQRYQLSHLNKKLDFIYSALQSANDSGISETVHSEIISTIQHLKTAKKEIEELISKHEIPQ